MTEDIAVQVRMDDGRGRPHCLFYVEYHWQIFIFDLDQITGSCRDCLCLSDHRGNPIAYKTDSVRIRFLTLATKHRLIIRIITKLIAGHIRGGKYCKYS